MHILKCLRVHALCDNYCHILCVGVCLRVEGVACELGGLGSVAASAVQTGFIGAQHCFRICL